MDLGDDGVPDVAALGRVHFIGIGGVGMSGLARILLARGAPVSGSDAKRSAVTEELAGLGALVHVGHDPSAVVGADTVVVSSAIRETNPELAAARSAGLRVLHRSQALAALMAGRRAVAVAGTHGKTTTTSMITVALRHCGADPSFAIGGELTGAAREVASAHEGGGDVFVAEADESDASFLRYRPTVAVVTNVEPDHLDHYGTPEAVAAAFDAFADRIVPGGVLVVGIDDPGARRLAEAVRRRRAGQVHVIGYGAYPDADVRITGARPTPVGITVDLVAAAALVPGGLAPPPARLTLQVPGVHNGANAAAAWTVGVWLGLDGGCVAEGLAAFGGTRRRFELKGEAAGVVVRDDYAHHPTEVAALLRAAREATTGRVLVVFQPHLYSRTRIFADEFANALALADEVVVLDVYAAREDPEPGVSGQTISTRVPLPAERVLFAQSADQAVARVVGRARTGDLVLTVGAGDVTLLGDLVLAALGADQRDDVPGAER